LREEGTEGLEKGGIFLVQVGECHHPRGEIWGEGEEGWL